ncbi:MAG: hypothetical protein ABJP66_24870 [Hyphomicrobiales bacterium]
MKILQSSLKIIIASVALIALSGAAQAEFCRKYQQTQSNAGHCNNCFITIKSDPSHQIYSATSNNGWYAEMNWVEGDSSVAFGGGHWLNGPKDEKFEIDMEQQGPTLRMTMQMYKNQKRGHVIRAQFRCVQR